MLWFAHPAAKLYADRLLKRDFAGRGGFGMTGGLKDVRLMISAADECNASLEIGKMLSTALLKAWPLAWGSKIGVRFTRSQDKRQVLSSCDRSAAVARS
jgi:hypothetical protein